MKLSQIESRTIQKQSLMPDGIVNNLTPEELADLIAYLQSLTESNDPPKKSDPVPAAPENPTGPLVQITAPHDYKRMMDLRRSRGIIRSTRRAAPWPSPPAGG